LQILLEGDPIRDTKYNISSTTYNQVVVALLPLDISTDNIKQLIQILSRLVLLHYLVRVCDYLVCTQYFKMVEPILPVLKVFKSPDGLLPIKLQNTFLDMEITVTAP